MKKNTNKLIHETSPYLLQHAHNPVDWQAWNEEALAEARQNDKLILVSIGYSSCHWCHVMEEESFEDENVAKIMNDNFVCIKVDREERPDIDHLYMTALQLITGRGGWPLNAISLPDGKPIWTASYVPKENWKNVLLQIADMYRNDRIKVIEYAENISNNIISSDIIELNERPTNTSNDYLKKIILNWSKSFDHQYGGYNYAPKFPLPNNFQFLLRYAYQFNDENIRKHVLMTLEKIAFGGIYDHIGGGFARYSTDKKWHVPHFEKMLYDNAQLVSLFSEAFALSENNAFKTVIDETLNFVSKEMKGELNNFYSALDADSFDNSGIKEEGAYYVWTKEELKNLITEDFDLFSEYYNVNDFGYWEHGKYVLIRTESDLDFALRNKIDVDELKDKIKKWNRILLQGRQKRAQPGLDDKSLCSWNSLMTKAFVDAYFVTFNNEYLKAATENYFFIEKNMMKPDGSLYRNFAKGKTSINAFLEDYALLTETLIKLYEATFLEKYLIRAKELTDYCFEHFYDSKSSMFYFTSDLDEVVLTRKIETYDGVISSSNSIIASNLVKLNHYYQKKKYSVTAKQMIKNMQEQIEYNPSAYSRWLDVFLDLYFDFVEIAITGDRAIEFALDINKKFLPNKIIAASIEESSLPVLKGRYENGKTLIYVCRDGICNMPVEGPGVSYENDRGLLLNMKNATQFMNGIFTFLNYEKFFGAIFFLF